MAEIEYHTAIASCAAHVSMDKRQGIGTDIAKTSSGIASPGTKAATPD
jgi:hypothetical protein